MTVQKKSGSWNESDIGFVNRLAQSLETHPFIDVPLTTLSDKVKVHKVYLAVGMAVVFVLLAKAFGTGHLLLDFLGCIYLLISTTKARESQKTVRYPFLLNSWLCFTFFKFFEGLTDDYVSRIPFYILIKAVFLFWCLSPIFKGANVIYHYGVRHVVLSKSELDKRAGAVATEKEEEEDEDQSPTVDSKKGK